MTIVLIVRVRVGLGWSYLDGQKYWDDLSVTSLPSHQNLTLASLTAEGGDYHHYQRQLELEFPQLSCKRNCTISITETPPELRRAALSGDIELEPRLAGGPFAFYSLHAHRSDGSAIPDLEFQKPVTLSYSYHPDLLGDIVEESLHIKYYNPDLQAFEILPSTVLSDQRRVMAQINHFSDYGPGGEEAGWRSLGIQTFDVGLSRGNASYLYDLPVPTGAGGLTPKLSLRYNSAIPNSMLGTDHSDTGWVGTGWTLDLGSINNGHLTLNGLSEDLIPDAHDTSRFYTKHQSFLDIRFFAGNYPESVTTCLKDIQKAGWWQVRDRAGFTYYFGTDNSGQGSSLSYLKHVGGNTDNSDHEGWAWRHRVYKLYRIEDKQGNRMEITYSAHGGRARCGIRSVAESYPTAITYTLNEAETPLHAEYELTFNVQEKGYTPGHDTYIRYGDRSYKLEDLYVWYHPLNQDAQLIRHIDFVYDTDDDEETNLLTEIVIKDQNGTPRPGLSFNYDNKLITAFHRNSDRDLVYHDKERPFLIKILNHYGAEIDYDYQASIYKRGQRDYDLFQVVERRTIRDSTTTQASVYDYAYGARNLVPKTLDNGR